MNLDNKLLKSDEKAIFALRDIYQKYGYSQYKMSKFEEYDLYVRNKNFLLSDNIITFTDTNGKLMALKPDVTLSIIKNIDDNLSSVQKLYYNENVYRISKGTNSYKEIMQVGLECIGSIDDYNIYETMLLACKSLNEISENFVLDISHLGILSRVISDMNISKEAEHELIKCISEKNIHGLISICNKENADYSILKELISTYGPLEKVLPILKKLKYFNEVNQLLNIVTLLENNGYKNKVKIDFSVVNDMNYYNGFVFKGFIQGISAGILSGGEYDNLMEKMKKSSKAIGFAVYLDLLERFSSSKKNFDVDTLIIYDDNYHLEELINTINKIKAEGKTIMVQKNEPKKIRYKEKIILNSKGVQNNA